MVLLLRSLIDRFVEIVAFQQSHRVWRLDYGMQVSGDGRGRRENEGKHVERKGP